MERLHRGELCMAPNYDNDDYARVYNQSMSAFKYYNTDDRNGITMAHFLSVYNLYAFDLTSDGNCDADHQNITKSGSITIKLRFNKALSSAINVILYPIFLMQSLKLQNCEILHCIMSYSR